MPDPIKPSRGDQGRKEINPSKKEPSAAPKKDEGAHPSPVSAPHDADEMDDPKKPPAAPPPEMEPRKG
jgi:hypothetical protein